MGERLAETNTPYLCPFLPLHDKKRIGKRLAEELKAWNLPAHEVKAAAAAAWDEEEAYKQKIYDITKKILDNLEKTGQRAIVLCGRPYHIDPEINHGIPELINILGLAVLTEDGSRSPGPVPGPPARRRPVVLPFAYLPGCPVHHIAASEIWKLVCEFSPLVGWFDAIVVDQV